MKKYLLILLWLTISYSTFTQKPKKIFSSLLEGNLQEAEAEYGKLNIAENKYSVKEDILLDIANCLLMIEIKSPRYNPIVSIMDFNGVYIPNEEKEDIIKFLAKYELDLEKISDRIYSEIVIQAKKLNTIESYANALQVCSERNRIELLELQEEAVYRMTILDKSIIAYKAFIIRYPKSYHRNEIQSLLERTVLDLAKKSQVIEELNSFIQEYSTSKLNQEATDFRDSIVLLKVPNNYDSMLAFIKVYPNSKFTNEVKTKLPNILYNESIELNTIESLNRFINEFPIDIRTDSIKVKLEDLFYKEAIKTNTIQSLIQFKLEFPNYYKLNELDKILVDLKFKETVELNTKESLLKFYKEYPKYFKINLIDSLFYSTIDEQSVLNLKEYLNLFPKGKFSSRAKNILKEIEANHLLTSQKSNKIGNQKVVDQNNISTVNIGGQTWTKTNLDVSHFRNGDLIPEAKSDKEWIDASLHHRPAWCYYDNNPIIGKKMGKLYNWYAVKDIRGLAPAGFHIANNEEFRILFHYLGSSNYADTRIDEKTANKLKSTSSSWNSNKGVTNESNFSALPSGRRIETVGSFIDLNEYAYWWTTDGFHEIGEGDSYSAGGGDVSIDRWVRGPGGYSDGGEGMAVRCLKGESNYNIMVIPVIDNLLIKYDDATGKPLEGKWYYRTGGGGETEKTFVNGLQQGFEYWKNYKRDTIIISSYKDGLLDGKYINKERHERGFYKKGKKNGVWGDDIDSGVEYLYENDVNLNDLYYNQAINLNTIESYNKFINDFSGDRRVYLIKEKLDDLIFKSIPKVFSTVKDIDGNTYKTVKIGNQEWFAENLITSSYNDGTTIPKITDAIQWMKLSYNNTGGWSYYQYSNDTEDKTYGKLYNGYVVNLTMNGNKNVCPTGWHVPFESDWSILIDYLGGNKKAGDKMKEVGIEHWERHETEATNSSFFTGQPGGLRNEKGRCDFIGLEGCWWCSSFDNYIHKYFYLGYNSNANFSQSEIYYQYGLSIRCLKD